MSTQKIEEFNEDLIDDEYQDPDNIEDSEFLIKLDDKYCLRRDRFQFKLGNYNTRIDKDGNSVKEWKTHSYYPVFSCAMLGYTELLCKTKAKEPKELVKEYTSKYKEFKKYTTDLSELVEKLYKENSELKEQNSRLNSTVTNLQLKLEKKAKV